MAVSVRLAIELHQDGNVTVNGPLQNKLQCYGLLEIARQLIQDWKPQSSLVVPSSSRLPPFPVDGAK